MHVNVYINTLDFGYCLRHRFHSLIALAMDSHSHRFGFHLLLADDEHMYNVFWSKLMTGKLEPRNQFEQKLLQTNSIILEKVVLGTDVVDVFESFNSSTQ